MSDLVGLFPYWAVIVLMMTGLYIVIAQGNLVKKLIGLGIFQVSVFVLYIAIGVVDGATPPILSPGFNSYSNPLPSVLILTAIVVGVATLAVGLALAVRIRESFGTIEEEDLLPLTMPELPPDGEARS
ncbi:cation:proton antiporter subunit C [Zavarzinia aquatilis]|uniref:Na+/H+ antiporter subunit C n=1 Tax=Zavarzinia aquatilis TaxID=2211142 RepID=A0A317EGX1_9PROT|nr:cation:proton antiporter subunit C [Zavarzinia aquatilis]PWR25564.1 Na+/H+ antiporter subunit C [Zavarzinia aquatilis]